MSTPPPRPTFAQLVNLASRLLSSLGDEQLRPLGFRYAQVPVLAMLRDGRKLTQAELVRRTGVEQSSMAQLLARLERDGAIERTPRSDNARQIEIAVTRATAQRLPAARARLLALDQEALAGLSEDEEATLFSLLERVLENLRTQTPTSDDV